MKKATFFHRHPNVAQFAELETSSVIGVDVRENAGQDATEIAEFHYGPDHLTHFQSQPSLEDVIRRRRYTLCVRNISPPTQGASYEFVRSLKTCFRENHNIIV